MGENEQGGMRRHLGMSRRDLLRRGAIAGGTLLWAAPVLSSLNTPAYASGTSFLHSCCVGTQKVARSVCPSKVNVIKQCDHFTLQDCQAGLAAVGATFVTYQSCTKCGGYDCKSGCLGSPGIDEACHQHS